MSKTKIKGDNQRSSERIDTYRYILAVIIMGIFTFLFLCKEYLYVDRISLNVSEDKAVLAQNYALGVSVLGFVLYPIFRRYCNKMYRWIGNLVITNASLKLLSSGGNMTTFVFLIVMFIVVSVVGVAYTFQRHQLMRKDAEQRQAELSEEEKVHRMVVRYSLTPREMEVLYQLVSTEDSIQEVAEVSQPETGVTEQPTAEQVSWRNLKKF